MVFKENLLENERSIGFNKCEGTNFEKNKETNEETRSKIQRNT